MTGIPEAVGQKVVSVHSNAYDAILVLENGLTIIFKGNPIGLPQPDGTLKVIAQVVAHIGG